jgi:hypothetical protein
MKNSLLEWTKEIDAFVKRLLAKLSKNSAKFSEKDFWVMSALSRTNFYNIGKVLEDKPIDDMIPFLGNALKYFTLAITAPSDRLPSRLAPSKAFYENFYSPGSEQAVKNFQTYTRLCNNQRNAEFVFDLKYGVGYHYESKIDAVYRFLKSDGDDRSLRLLEYEVAAIASAREVWKQIVKNFSFTTRKSHFLYRGIVMNPQDPVRFKKELSAWFKSKNPYFTYCSTSRDVALMYAQDKNPSASFVGIVFKIAIPPGTRICPLLTCSKSANLDEFIITGAGDFTKISEKTRLELVSEEGEGKVYEAEISFIPGDKYDNNVFYTSIESKFAERFASTLGKLQSTLDYIKVKN